MLRCSYLWIFFRAPDFTTAAMAIERFGIPSTATLMTPLNFALAIAFLTAAHVLFYRIDLRAAIARINPAVFAIGYGAAVAVILPFVSVGVQPFIHFQF